MSLNSGVIRRRIGIKIRRRIGTDLPLNPNCR
jgi:hypothetical protein